MTTTPFVDEFFIDTKKLWLAATALLEADKIHDSLEKRVAAFQEALATVDGVSQEDITMLAEKSFQPEQEV